MNNDIEKIILLSIDKIIFPYRLGCSWNGSSIFFPKENIDLDNFCINCDKKMILNILKSPLVTIAFIKFHLNTHRVEFYILDLYDNETIHRFDLIINIDDGYFYKCLNDFLFYNCHMFDVDAYNNYLERISDVISLYRR